MLTELAEVMFKVIGIEVVLLSSPEDVTVMVPVYVPTARTLPGVIWTLTLAGVLLLEGAIESQLKPELVVSASVKVNCWLGSELLRTIGFGGLLVVLNCTGRAPCCRVSDCNPVGIVMLSRAPLLTKSVTPISVEVVPLVGVFELTVMAPVQLPGPRPVVTMLTVSEAGVVLDDSAAWNQPDGQLLVGAVLTLNDRGSEIPELVICVACDGGAT